MSSGNLDLLAAGLMPKDSLLPFGHDSSMTAALLNILEDANSEKEKQQDTQRAIMNIVDDLQSERALFQDAQRAALNILEDFTVERERLELMQKAVLNILEDFDAERTKVESINYSLRTEVEERIAAEKEIVKKSLALSRSNSELEQFAFIASHDLQAPLRTISSFIEIIGDKVDSKNDETMNRHMGFVQGGVTRMQSLIKALLEYSRVGREALPFRNMSSAKICEAVMKDLTALMEECEAIVTFDDLPTVYGDYTMLRQLFQNLIGNAIKFRGDRPPVVKVTACQKGDHWQFSVIDNGIGINAAHSSRLFTIFQRLNAGEKYPGTGIGLAICKKIVEFHGGKIWLDSDNPIGGTVFSFILPDRVGAHR